MELVARVATVSGVADRAAKRVGHVVTALALGNLNAIAVRGSGDYTRISGRVVQEFGAEKVLTAFGGSKERAEDGWLASLIIQLNVPTAKNSVRGNFGVRAEALAA